MNTSPPPTAASSVPSAWMSNSPAALAMPAVDSPAAMAKNSAPKPSVLSETTPQPTSAATSAPATAETAAKAQTGTDVSLAPKIVIPPRMALAPPIGTQLVRASVTPPQYQ